MIRNEETTEHYRQIVRNWVQNVAIPNEDRVAALNEVPEDLVADMKKQGFFGWSIPEEYGGAGLTTEELVLMALELSYCSVAFRARVGTNTGIGSESLIVDGTTTQKEQFLPRLATGEIVGCFALTEREAGSEATALSTLAIRDGSDYILNGSKAFITNAPISDLFTVFARTNPDDPSHRGISAFLIERNTPGLSVGPAYTMMGQSGSPVSEVYFNDCRVPAECLLGGEAGVGFKTAMKALNKQRIHLSALSTGPAMRMLDEATKHSLERKQFGTAIGDFQLVQGMIADSHTEIAAARTLIMDTARKRDEGVDISLAASMCKYFATEMCGRVADRAVQIFGGSGYVADYSNIERFYRDVRLFRLYEGTSQIHQLNIAKLTKKQVSETGSVRI
ncbi:acyl-CoA dehydrogenase family protein [Sneathiella sp.]|uniref:acyl-CoA dehydrogenase family protein n=1 Tax=Sneathiella sp. TaxID=1964365 RepID=UPI003562921A